MNRALFVDDERGLLDGLRGRLRTMRLEWQMKFVDSAEAAIAELAQAPHELVVADIRMPAMDGVQLLTQVSERWPATMRVALSGYANQEQTLQLIPIAHQYLSKPCAPQALESVLRRCAQLQQILPVPRLRELVGRVRQLTPTPGTLTKMLQAMEDPQCKISDIAKLVAADTVVAAKVLQMVNSAFFRLGHPVSRIEQAVNYLGLPAMKTLIDSSSVFHCASTGNCPPEFDLTVLQAQANAMAVSAAKNGLTGNAADEAVVAALLQNIAYWVLVQEAPDDLAKAAEHVRHEGVALHIAEIAVLGASHAQVGAYLLGLWGLPDTVMNAVLEHHSGETTWQDTMMVQALNLSHHPARRESAATTKSSAIDATHIRRR